VTAQRQELLEWLPSLNLPEQGRKGGDARVSKCKMQTAMIQPDLAIIHKREDANGNVASN